MPTKQLYDTWIQRTLQLGQKLSVSQRRNLTSLLIGIYLSGSVYLSKVAPYFPGSAVNPSKERRARRFLDNSAVRVRPTYEPVARQLFLVHAHRGRVALIIDSTKVGAGHQLLMVALATRKRALPVAWTWQKGKKGHSAAAKQLALLAYVHRLIPPGLQVVLVGDTEFEAGAVSRQLDDWGWGYVLRQKSNNQVQPEAHGTWQRFGDLVQKPGESRWLSGVPLTCKHAWPTNLLAHWAVGEKEAWLLATNLPTRLTTLQAYRKRMWIEEMFGDLKDNGFDLEATRLKHFERLSRLTLVVALVYVWCLSTGTRVIKNGLRRLVDRNDRRDLSVFQIGLRYLERLLLDGKKVSNHLCPLVS